MGWGAAMFGVTRLSPAFHVAFQYCFGGMKWKGGKPKLCCGKGLHRAFTIPWIEETKESVIGRKADIKDNYHLNQSKLQKSKVMPQDKKPVTNKPAKKKQSVFLHVQDALAASGWQGQDDRKDSNRRTSATAVLAAASILLGGHQFAINSLQAYQVCLTAFQKKASGCSLRGTGLSLIPSNVRWLQGARDWQWQTLMEALPSLLMYVRSSASLTPACSACRSVQLLAVKWPNANHTGKRKHIYSIS